MLKTEYFFYSFFSFIINSLYFTVVILIVYIYLFLLYLAIPLFLCMHTLIFLLFHLLFVHTILTNYFLMIYSLLLFLLLIIFYLFFLTIFHYVTIPFKLLTLIFYKSYSCFFALKYPSILHLEKYNLTILIKSFFECSPLLVNNINGLFSLNPYLLPIHTLFY